MSVVIRWAAALFRLPGTYLFSRPHLPCGIFDGGGVNYEKEYDSCSGNVGRIDRRPAIRRHRRRPRTCHDGPEYSLLGFGPDGGSTSLRAAPAMALATGPGFTNGNGEAVLCFVGTVPSARRRLRHHWDPRRRRGHRPPGTPAATLRSARVNDAQSRRITPAFARLSKPTLQLPRRSSTANCANTPAVVESVLRHLRGRLRAAAAMSSRPAVAWNCRRFFRRKPTFSGVGGPINLFR